MDASSCLIRVVTAEGTRCSLWAALITPPSSTTLLNTWRSAKFMAQAFIRFQRTSISIIFNIIEYEDRLCQSRDRENIRAIRGQRRPDRAAGVGQRHGHRAL